MFDPSTPLSADGSANAVSALGLLGVVVMMVAGATALLAVFAAVRARREQALLSPLRPAPLQTPLTVVIPARNEAERLPATLEALLREPSPSLHVVVVDDASTDGTAAVVKRFAEQDPRVELQRPTWPPTAAHLFGKPRALHAAITGHPRRADDELVLCLDADVVLADGALGGCVAAMQPDDAALSVAPALTCESLAEVLLVPAFVATVGVTHPPSKVLDPDSPTAFLNGQLMLLRRQALVDVGGFASVADTVLEDVALARRLKQRGARLRLLDGRARSAPDGAPMVRTRMYDDLPGVLLGFAKNARALHGAALPGLALLLMVAGVAPWVCLLIAAVTAGSVDDLGCAAAWLVTTVAAASNRRALGSPMWPALVSPLVQLTVGGTLLWAHLRRQGRWRGRTFST